MDRFPCVTKFLIILITGNKSNLFSWFKWLLCSFLMYILYFLLFFGAFLLLLFQYWKKVVICCEVNHCQYLSSTWCFIRVFQHGFLLVYLRLVDCLTGLHIGITREGNRRIVVVSEINNNNFVAYSV